MSCYLQAIEVSGINTVPACGSGGDVTADAGCQASRGLAFRVDPEPIESLSQPLSRNAPLEQTCSHHGCWCGQNELFSL